jgi:TonB family protein
MPDWKNFEGQLLDGKYPLMRYVSGDASRALFLIGFASSAVRIRRADAAVAAGWVERWNRVKLLNHPHLLEIDAAGASVIAGESVAYAVMEHGDENLAEILRDRPLSPDEALELLRQVASTLEDLHAQGMAHGDLKASNIFATGNTVKLSSESVGEGDPAGDVRALGLTLVHAFTQRADDPRGAADLPAPFGEIARGCLHPNPARRWTAKEIVARLRSPAATPAKPARAAAPRFARIAGAAGLVVAGVAIVAAVVTRTTETPSPAAARPRKTETASAIAPVPAPVVPERKADAPAPAETKPESTRDRVMIEDGVAHRVVPDVPEKARNTIEGRPVVAVLVTVDAAGNVTDASVERTFSPYFSRLALQSARQWKFAPEEGAGPREWSLRFRFTQRDTQATAQRVRK